MNCLLTQGMCTLSWSHLTTLCKRRPITTKVKYYLVSGWSNPNWSRPSTLSRKGNSSSWRRGQARCNPTDRIAARPSCRPNIADCIGRVLPRVFTRTSQVGIQCLLKTHLQGISSTINRLALCHVLRRWSLRQHCTKRLSATLSTSITLLEFKALCN